jgi:hypothetical protein
VECVRFSPDGRFLISAGGIQKKMPGEIHIWRLAGTIKAESIDTKKLTEAQSTALWETLGSADDVGFETLKILLASPKTALLLFKERVRSTAAPDAQLVAKWIAKLDDDKFAEREKATTELRTFNELIEPVLLKTLESPASDEVRGRVAQLLKRVEAPNMSQGIVRSLRIVEILDRIATPEAKQLLTEFAKGTPETWLVREAKLALSRMERR